MLSKLRFKLSNKLANNKNSLTLFTALDDLSLLIMKTEPQKSKREDTMIGKVFKLPLNYRKK